MNSDLSEFDANTLFVMWIDQFDKIVDWKSNHKSSDLDPLDLGEKNRYVGTNLFDYVLGHFTRQFLRKFLNSARETREQKRLLYRCDSPSHKQLMEMRACASPDGEIRISHTLVETEAFEFEISLQNSLNPHTSRVLRCSICNRLRRRGKTDWCEAESIAVPDTVLRVIHTVCPDCRTGLNVKPISTAIQT